MQSKPFNDFTHWQTFLYFRKDLFKSPFKDHKLCALIYYVNQVQGWGNDFFCSLKLLLLVEYHDNCLYPNLFILIVIKEFVGNKVNAVQGCSVFFKFFCVISKYCMEAANFYDSKMWFRKVRGKRAQLLLFFIYCLEKLSFPLRIYSVNVTKSTVVGVSF